MRHLTRTLLILPLLAASLCSVAADKPTKKESSFGGAKPTGPYLTKEQLRACMTQQDKIQADDTELKAEQAALTTRKEAIARGGDELKTKLETIDRTNPEAVNGYNEAVQARDKEIDAYQARVTAFNTRVDANQEAHGTFGANCSNRRYFEEDEIAIKKGK